jgi:hypothetical protein
VRHMFRLATYLCLALPLCGFAAVFALAQNTDIAVVVNSSNPIDDISVVELKKIFMGQKQSWPGNIPMKLLVRGAGAHERQALLRLLGMSERDYKQYWTTQMFRGDTQFEPITVASNSVQKQAVNTFAGAIALMTAGEAKTGMKVIKIDGHLPGEADYPTEFADYRIKAGFIYRFAQFIDWPADSFKDASSPVTFCTSAPDPFGGALNAAVTGKLVRGRPLQVRHSDKAEDLARCQILFIGEADEKRTASLLANVQNLPIATLGDGDHFVAHGGLIGFVWVGRDIRFDVNLDAAGPARLRISSQLLSLAKKVTGVMKGN